MSNVPAEPADGDPLPFPLVGDTTFKETPQQALGDVPTIQQDDTITGATTTFILLEDFNIPVHSRFGILTVTNAVMPKLDVTI